MKFLRSADWESHLNGRGSRPAGQTQGRSRSPEGLVPGPRSARNQPHLLRIKGFLCSKYINILGDSNQSISRKKKDKNLKQICQNSSVNYFEW